MNKLILFIGASVLVSVALSQEAPKDATVTDASNVNTRLFTNDANTNNNIASGLLGVGLGVGGVLLTQAFLDSQKPKCGPYRSKRDDGVQGRFFNLGGLGGGNNNYNNRPCPPPGYPGGYVPPYNQGYAPAYPQQGPYNQGYAPNYNQGYNQYPQSQHGGYRRPHNNGNYAPSNNYNNNYAPANNYNNQGYNRPQPFYPQQQGPSYPNSGYAPGYQGRSLLGEVEEAKAEDLAAATPLTADAPSSDAVRFEAR